MAVISKFVINRNKVGFFYVEKHLNKNKITYIYNDGSDFGEMSQETFHSTFGNDKKYSLLKFLEKVQIDLLKMIIDDERIPKLGLDAINIVEKLKKENLHNPSIIGYLFSFLNILSTYNSLVFKNIEAKKKNGKDIDIDYEEEYKKVQGMQRKQEF